MRCYYFLICAILCSPLYAETIDPGSAEAEIWLEADSTNVFDVNEGELEFFTAPPPGGPFHHHQNRLTITPSSLTSGWVALEQCHDHLDAVPRSEITFRKGRVRKIAITLASGIDKVWVEAHSVQLEGVSTDARLCLTGELKLITQLSDGRFILKSGPYMRRFLDGYYPMKVSLSVFQKGLSRNLELVTPKPKNGLIINQIDDELHIETLFVGRLILELELIDQRPH